MAEPSPHGGHVLNVDVERPSTLVDRHPYQAWRLQKLVRGRACRRVLCAPVSHCSTCPGSQRRAPGKERHRRGEGYHDER